VNHDISSSVTYTDETVYVNGSLTGGTITLNNATLIVEGTANSSHAIVNMQSGINTLDLAHVSTSASGNPTVVGFSSGDSIGLGTAFTSVTIQHDGHSNATATFLNSGTPVGVLAIPNDNDLSGGFYSTTATETLGGTTYTVATLDPGTGATGPTGPTGGHHKGSSSPATINQNTVLGATGTTSTSFLQSTGTQGGPSGPTSHGLGQLLGGQLTTDLTNFGSLVSGLRHDGQQTGAGSQTPQVTGVGAAFGQLDHGNKPADVLKPDTSIVPKH
jgi:hypothetical protein